MSNKESISKFFERLGFKLRNIRVSWGARNGDMILLRCWDYEQEKGPGAHSILVYENEDTSSWGLKERKDQVADLWRGGQAAYVVIVKSRYNRKGELQLGTFRNDIVYPVLGLKQEGEKTFALLGEAIAVGEPLRNDMRTRKVQGLSGVPFSSAPAPPFAGPDEVQPLDDVTEGALRQVTINAYERDGSARLRCIARWGHACRVCGFDFGLVYGELGKGYIHVHHLKPLHTIGKEYLLNPETDLRPVCPNCHAMLHRTKDTLSIEELKSQLKVRFNSAA